MVKIEDKTFFTSGEQKDEYINHRQELVLEYIRKAMGMLDKNTHVYHLLEDVEAHVDREVLRFKLSATKAA